MDGITLLSLGQASQEGLLCILSDDFAVAQTCRAVAIIWEIRLSQQLQRDESRESATVLINKLCWLQSFAKGRSFIF